jgi:hypothetical protein
MSFGRIKTRLMALINRKDFTDGLAGDFILDAISANERLLRIGPMETVFDKSDWDGIRNVLPVPDNYLQLISIFDDDGEYTEVDFDTFLKTRTAHLGSRGVYTKVADRWLLKPVPPVDHTIFLHFYAETIRPVFDTDSTVWTEAGFLATLYKAAELAADFYQMEQDQVMGYRSKAEEHVSAIADQSLSEAWSGRISIPPPSGLGDY